MRTHSLSAKSPIFTASFTWLGKKMVNLKYLWLQQRVNEPTSFPLWEGASFKSNKVNNCVGRDQSSSFLLFRTKSLAEAKHRASFIRSLKRKRFSSAINGWLCCPFAPHYRPQLGDPIIFSPVQSREKNCLLCDLEKNNLIGTKAEIHTRTQSDSRSR